MKIAFLSSILVATLFQTSCGSIDKKSKKEDYSYNFSYNGCKTKSPLNLRATTAHLF
jgi:hypothetical protein